MNLCITMNLHSHRGGYTLLTFITVILFPVFPLSDSVSGGVYTFLSSRHYRSVYSGLNWKGPPGMVSEGSFPPTLPPDSTTPTSHHLDFSPSPFPTPPLVYFHRNTLEEFSLEHKATNGLPILAFYSSVFRLTCQTFRLYSSLPPPSNSWNQTNNYYYCNNRYPWKLQFLLFAFQVSAQHAVSMPVGYSGLEWFALIAEQLIRGPWKCDFWLVFALGALSRGFVLHAVAIWVFFLKIRPKRGSNLWGGCLLEVIHLWWAFSGRELRFTHNLDKLFSLMASVPNMSMLTLPVRLLLLLSYPSELPTNSPF